MGESSPAKVISCQLCGTSEGPFYRPLDQHGKVYEHTGICCQKCGKDNGWELVKYQATDPDVAKRTKHRDRKAFRNYIYNTLKIDKEWLQAQVREAVRDLLREELDRRLGAVMGEQLVNKLLRDVIREEMAEVLLGPNKIRSAPSSTYIQRELEKLLLGEIKALLIQRFKLSVNMELVEPEPKVDRTVIAPHETFRGSREV